MDELTDIRRFLEKFPTAVYTSDDVYRLHRVAELLLKIVARQNKGVLRGANDDGSVSSPEPSLETE